MILRVWAMYNRSRLILSALLAVFLLEIIFIVIVNAMYSNARNRLPVAAIQILDFSFCVVQPTSPIWRNIATILQTTHGAAMCILAIIQFVRQSLQMYRVTKQWQISRYTSLLVREGILYFFAVFLFSLLDALNGSGTIPAEGWQADLSIFLEYVPMYALSPRSILNIRKLYARDVQGRRGDGIDSGFGLSSSGRGAGGTEIVFADVEQSHELEDLEEIPMEVMTTQPE
ncbi:hypothetical protein OG21DRAFT_749816 [Imleria badia]|nr:hypothetical protein OG21DRAFT_749816 [Imleria badia]